MTMSWLFRLCGIFKAINQDGFRNLNNVVSEHTFVARNRDFAICKTVASQDLASFPGTQ